MQQERRGAITKPKPGDFLDMRAGSTQCRSGGRYVIAGGLKAAVIALTVADAAAVEAQARIAGGRQHFCKRHEQAVRADACLAPASNEQDAGAVLARMQHAGKAGVAAWEEHWRHANHASISAASASIVSGVSTGSA
jgi:hypothetical protein